MLLTNNWDGGRGRKAIKVIIDILSFVSFSLAFLPPDSCPLSSSLAIHRSRTHWHREMGRVRVRSALPPRNLPGQGTGRKRERGGFTVRRRAGGSRPHWPGQRGGEPAGRDGEEGTQVGAWRPSLWEQNKKQNSLQTKKCNFFLVYHLSRQFRPFILQLDCSSVTQWDVVITFAAEVRF